jgi:hypothetical protein
MVAVALGESLDTVGGKVGHRRCQRVPESQSDDMARALQTWYPQTQIGRGFLDRAGDHRGRVDHGAIPVEDDEVKRPWHGCVRPAPALTGCSRPAAS